MAVTAHVFPALTQAMGLSSWNVNFPGDSIKVLLIASGTYTWNATAIAAVHVSDFLAGSGAGALTEVAGGGTNYTRQVLATVAINDTISAPYGYTTVTVTVNPTWVAPNFTCSYALFYDDIFGNDASNLVICYWDLGGAQVAAPAHPFTLQLGSANGVSQALVQWQSA